VSIFEVKDEGVGRPDKDYCGDNNAENDPNVKTIAYTGGHCAIFFVSDMPLVF
jgi:hypothetical protein